MSLKGIIVRSALQAIILGAGLAICGGAEAMDIASYELMHQPSASAERQLLLKASIVGTGQGYTWANAYLESVGQTAMFCAPKKLALNADNYLQMLDEQIQLERSVYVTSGVDIPGVLLDALQAKFPCQADKKK